MFKSLKFINEDRTSIMATTLEGRMVEIAQASDPRFALIANGFLHEDGTVLAVDPYEAPEPPTEAEMLETERKAMSTSMAFLKIAILRSGQMGRALDILEHSPEAEILWSSGGKVSRNGYVCRVLAQEFDAEEVDDFFRSAMTLTL